MSTALPYRTAPRASSSVGPDTAAALERLLTVGIDADVFEVALRSDDAADEAVLDQASDWWGASNQTHPHLSRGES